ncbi:MAG: helix-turn-helix domain-containing protein [Pseudomonadota bacterium]
MKHREEAAKIRDLIFRKGVTCSSIDQAQGLRAGTCNDALYEPNTIGERALAKALGKPAHKLWPTRYWRGGVRKAPQPAENYRKRRRTAQRQKVEAA